MEKDTPDIHVDILEKERCSVDASVEMADTHLMNDDASGTTTPAERNKIQDPHTDTSTNRRYSLDSSVEMDDTHLMNDDDTSTPAKRIKAPSAFALLRRSTFWFCLASIAACLSLAHLSFNEKMVWIDAAPTTGFFWIAIGPRILSTVLSLTGHGSRLTDQTSIPWRETWREATLCGAAIALSMWFKTQAIARIELSQFQTLEVFVAPMLLQLMKPLKILYANPAPNLNLYTHLICLVMSFCLFAQTSVLPGIILGFASCFFQAVYLGLLKRWLLRAPQLTAYSVIHYMGPVTFTVSALVGCTSWIQSHTLAYDHLIQSITDALRYNALAWSGFIVFQGIEAFTLVAAIKETNFPVSVALLAPLRNLISLIWLGLIEHRMAMRDILRMGSVYLAMCFFLWDVESEQDACSSSRTRSMSENGDFGLMLRSPDLESTLADSSTCSTLVETKPPTSTRGIQLGYVAMLLLWLVQQPMTATTITTDSVLPDLEESGEMVPRLTNTLDAVFSYYKEPIDVLKSTIDWVQTMPSLSSTKRRIIIYVKDQDANLTHLMRVTGADEVMRLDNLGREGSTYLTHILRHYNASKSNPFTFENLNVQVDLGRERIVSTNRTDYGLADHTLFMQPHIENRTLAQPRLQMFNSNRTGFLSLGMYLTSDCGKDGLGHGQYDRMRDIFEIFHETICPPTLQLATYAGQFVVSKRRLLQNPYSKYSKLHDLINADDHHWLHLEGANFHWEGTETSLPADKVANNTISSEPFLGHSIERSWPIIFHCNEPQMFQECQESNMKNGENPWACQCTDPNPFWSKLMKRFWGKFGSRNIH